MTEKEFNVGDTVYFKRRGTYKADRDFEGSTSEMLDSAVWEGVALRITSITRDIVHLDSIEPGIETVKGWCFKTSQLQHKKPEQEEKPEVPYSHLKERPKVVIKFDKYKEKDREPRPVFKVTFNEAQVIALDNFLTKETCLSEIHPDKRRRLIPTSWSPSINATRKLIREIATEGKKIGKTHYVTLRGMDELDYLSSDLKGLLRAQEFEYRRGRQTVTILVGGEKE